MKVLTVWNVSHNDYITLYGQKYYAKTFNLNLDVQFSSITTGLQNQAPSYLVCFYKHLWKKWVILKSSVKHNSVIACHHCHNSVYEIIFLCVTCSSSTFAHIVYISAFDFYENDTQDFML